MTVPELLFGSLISVFDKVVMLRNFLRHHLKIRLEWIIKNFNSFLCKNFVSVINARLLFIYSDYKPINLIQTLKLKVLHKLWITRFIL